MKIRIMIAIVCLIVLDAGVLIHFKRYVKKHENELVEGNLKNLIVRVSAMVAITAIVGVLGILLQVV
ncbi:MAG: hypothetical protein ACI4A3_14110 [Lachnospiraceae bacterium]